MEYPKFRVCVKCITFNHSRYITDAMNGFTMQQTNFPYVCCIIDDASTDGAQEVIKEYVNKYFDLNNTAVSYERETEYANIIYAQHQTNKNCYFAVLLLKENLYSKKQFDKRNEYMAEWRNICEYEALCEGDDYWIVPDKLEKQVEYLDNNIEYILCGSNGLVIWENGDNLPYYFNKIFSGQEVAPNRVIGHWCMPTASLVYRLLVYENYPEWTRKIYSGDQTLLLIALSKGKLFCFGELMTIYRKSYLNKSSISMRYRKGSNGFEQRQHLILYKEYQAHVGDMFKVELDSVITHLLRDVKFYEQRDRYHVLAYVTNPRFTLINGWKLIKKRIVEVLNQSLCR